MFLGENIRIIRKKWKFSQEEFGTYFKLSKHTISAYENGKNEPSLEFMCRLEELTTLPIYALCQSQIAVEDILPLPLANKNPFPKLDKNYGLDMDFPHPPNIVKESISPYESSPKEENPEEVKQLKATIKEMQEQMLKMQLMLSGLREWQESVLLMNSRLAMLESHLKEEEE